MKKLVIEREAVKNNITVVKDRAGSACIYAVLTGDGFGAGITELAQLLREEGVGRFAVSEPAEAAALRKAGLVEEELLMLRPTTDREELEQLIDLNVVCTIGSADTGMALNGVAEARSTVAEAHIQIDTGMGFGGFLAAEPDKILSAYRNLPNVAISGVYTQIHATKRDGRDAAPQLEEFQQVVEAIRAAGSEGDSVGGVLETIVTGLPAGIGEPWFDSVESELAHLMFAVPACKGLEFGAGFAFASMRGSEANDPFAMRNGQVATATNKNGGINGGITNGMPLVFRTVLKPTPSIYKQQHTVDYIARQDADLQIKGRHDPCIVPRAAVVQNTLAAFGLLDLLTVRYGTLAQKHGLPQE